MPRLLVDLQHSIPSQTQLAGRSKGGGEGEGVEGGAGVFGGT